MAGIGIPVALGLVFLGGWYLAGTLSALGVLGTRELFRMARGQGILPLEIPGAVVAALLPVAVLASLPAGPSVDPSWFFLAGAIWVIVVMLGAMAYRRPDQRPLAAVSVTVFAPLYAAGLPAFLLWLRHSAAYPDPWAGTFLVFFPLAVTWICDSLAMLGGALVGGPKLAPVLSPRKTWAGAVTGVVGAMAVAPLYGHLVLARAGVALPLGALVLGGLLIGTLGQAGDLAESLFKREAGFKDSGTFFPGHGGVLDRLDSLYWNIPLTVLVLRAWGTL